MRFSTAIALVLAIATSTSEIWAQEETGDYPAGVELTVPMLKSSVVALKQFEQDQPNARADKVNIIVRDHKDSYEISFFPEPKPTRVIKGEKEDTIVMDPFFAGPFLLKMDASNQMEPPTTPSHGSDHDVLLFQ